MKKIACFLILLAHYATTHAQSVGINNSTPNTNAVLDIKQTTNKGLLIPRGNVATRNALNSNTAKGLMIYDTSTNSLWIHNGNGTADGWANQQPTTRGTIIPYASGNTPIVITTFLGGGTNTMAAIGFGNNISNITPVGSTIDLTASGSNCAFSMPRDGVISSVAVYFSNSTSLNLFEVPLHIYAQLYLANSGSNVFTPISSAITLLPAYFGATPVGTSCRGIISGLSIPVAAESRLMLVYYAIAFGSFNGNTVTGSASAGVTID